MKIDLNPFDMNSESRLDQIFALKFDYIQASVCSNGNSIEFNKTYAFHHI